MDASAGDLVTNKDPVSEEQQDNKQNESRVEGQAQNQSQTSASDKFRLTVEPILFFMTLAETVSVSVVTNYFEFKTCRLVMNFSYADCISMSNETEAKVQPISAELLMWKNVIESLLPAVLSFFIGPWSDTNGRRLLFLVSICGFLGYHIAWTVISVVPSVLPLSYFLLASLPKALTGGWVVVFVASYCYMVDITSIENRTHRIGLMECAILIGCALGYFLSPIFYKNGFAFAFGASTLLNLIALLYSFFFLKETIFPERGVRYNVFNWRYAYDMIATTFYKRLHNRRCIILLLMLTFFINIVIFLGESSIMFLWVKLQFQWKLSDFTTYQIISVTQLGLGSFGCLWLFSSKLGLPDLPLATVIVAFRVFSSVMLGFAIAPWQIYAASCVAMSSGAVGPLLRATVSKIVPKHEIGKVFALIASLEAIAPLIASPLYTLVYNAAIRTTSSIVFLMSAFLYTLTMTCIMIIMVIQWRFPAIDYSSINDGDIVA